MKKHTLLLFCICFLNIFSQQISVGASKMNVVYIGIDNPITIMANGINCEELDVKVSSGELTHTSACNYIYKPAFDQEPAIFQIFHKGKEIGKSIYRVKRIPDPQATLGGKLQGGAIHKGTLAAQTGLIALLKDFDFDARFLVQEFSMIICSKDYYYLEHQKNGPILTREMKKAIQDIKNGGNVIFADIVVIGPDNIRRKLPEMRYQLLEKTPSENNCPRNQFTKRTNYVVENDTSFSYFNCSCNTKLVKIETDKIEYKGVNNDYYFSSETIKTDTSELYIEYFESRKIKIEQTKSLENYSLECQNEKSLDYSKLHLKEYVEYFENGKIKIRGNFTLKETEYTIQKEQNFGFACGTISNCNYVEDVKDGEWLFYNEKGRLIYKEIYVLGKLVKKLKKARQTFNKKS